MSNYVKLHQIAKGIQRVSSMPISAGLSLVTQCSKLVQDLIFGSWASEMHHDQ